MNNTIELARPVAPAVDPDQHLIDILAEDPDAINRAGHDATQAFRKATALPHAPIAIISASWEAGKTAYGQAERAMNLCQGAAAVAARVELLKTAIKVRDEMAVFANMTLDQRMSASGARPLVTTTAEVAGSRLNGAEILALAKKAGLDINLSNGSDLEIHGDLQAHPDVHLVLQHQKRQVVGHLLSRRGTIL